MSEDRGGLPLPKICGLGEACCGCAACAAACPVPCIQMGPDTVGFLHPQVDGGACVRCGSCDRACPALNSCGGDEVLDVWWARANDGRLLEQSSSGGVFGLLARDVIARGGTVYGAAYEDGCTAVCHRRADSEGSLWPLMRSKYVQSSIGRDVYRTVEADLKAGRQVLFAGTACQVSGLGGYLRTRRVPTDGLLRVDVVCHGVPAPRLWRDWVLYRQGRAGTPLRSVNQRSKATGWETYSAEYRYSGAKVESWASPGDWYMRAFLANASLRGSCLACPAKRSCASDLTLGDFWGVRERHPEAYDDRGVSAVIANTEKGVAAIEALGASLVRGPSSLEDVAAGNPSLLRPVAPYPQREAFLDDVAAGVPLAELMSRWPFDPPKRVLWERARRLLARAWRRLYRPWRQRGESGSDRLELSDNLPVSPPPLDAGQVYDGRALARPHLQWGPSRGERP